MTTTTLSNINIPESITSLFDTKMKKCRIAWEKTATGQKSHGEWFPLLDEALLESHIAANNSQHAGKISHWIEYE